MGKSIGERGLFLGRGRAAGFAGGDLVGTLGQPQPALICLLHAYGTSGEKMVNGSGWADTGCFRHVLNEPT